jgi:hypothetical protein
MEHQERLQVELYAHGGWWKDNTGRSGQISEVHASKGPLATVAALANMLGVDGWELKDFASARHNSYYLSFELASDDERADDRPSNGEQAGDEGHPDPLVKSVAIRLG